MARLTLIQIRDNFTLAIENPRFRVGACGLVGDSHNGPESHQIFPPNGAAAVSTETQEHYEKVKAALQHEDGSALTESLSEIHAADIAEIYELLDEEERSRMMFALPPGMTAQVVVFLDEADRGEAIEDMSQAELTELTTEMELDDAADILGELTTEEREEILEHIPDEQADKLKELLAYGEDTAGGIMTKDLVSLPASATVREAVREIRSNFKQSDVHNVYLVDDDERLVGVVKIRDLVLNDQSTPLGAIANREPVAVRVDDDQEAVARVFAKYDFAAVPVVDAEGHLLGRITHDDAMDVAEEEAQEDMYRMVGINAAEFESSSIMRAATLRLSWLVPCLASMAITAAVMKLSQGWFHELAAYAALVVFVPMIGAIGGNCGIQISTVIVRGLATGDLAATRFRYAFSRESRIALIMSPVCGLAAWGICRLGLPVLQQFAHHVPGTTSGLPFGASIHRISFAVGIGMASAILIAATLGMILPFFFRRIGVDPAIAAGPIVTTANDIISVSIFLGLASVIVAM